MPPTIADVALMDSAVTGIIAEEVSSSLIAVTATRRLATARVGAHRDVRDAGAGTKAAADPRASRNVSTVDLMVNCADGCGGGVCVGVVHGRIDGGPPST